MLKQEAAEREPSRAEQRGCFETAEIPLAGLVLKPAPGFHTHWLSQWVPPGCHLQNTLSAHSHILGATAEAVAGWEGETQTHRMFVVLNLCDI